MCATQYIQKQATYMYFGHEHPENVKSGLCTLSCACTHWFCRWRTFHTCHICTSWLCNAHLLHVLLNWPVQQNLYHNSNTCFFFFHLLHPYPERGLFQLRSGQAVASLERETTEIRTNVYTSWHLYVLSHQKASIHSSDLLQMPSILWNLPMLNIVSSK